MLLSKTVNEAVAQAAPDRKDAVYKALCYVAFAMFGTLLMLRENSRLYTLKMKSGMIGPR